MIVRIGSATGFRRGTFCGRVSVATLGSRFWGSRTAAGQFVAAFCLTSSRRRDLWVDTTRPKHSVSPQWAWSLRHNLSASVSGPTLDPEAPKHVTLIFMSLF